MEEVKESRLTFKKDERLCSKIIIDKLFSEGETVFSYPLRFVFIPTIEKDGNYPIQIVFSVPRRNFKKAVDRNLIKRRMREAYRLEKSQFYLPLLENRKNIALMVIYTDKTIVDYDKIHRSLIKGMKKLITKTLG